MLLKLARIRHEYGNNEDYAKFMTPFICSLMVDRLENILKDAEDEWIDCSDSSSVAEMYDNKLINLIKELRDK